MKREDGRRAIDLRRVEITRGYTIHAPGSVLIRTGHTAVLCTASWEPSVPEWMAGKGSGWLTAEYDMLPSSTHKRRSRTRAKLDGRTQEIQRLIGRSLRAVSDLDGLGENTVYIDCDVLQADGGTRTASITGAYVAFHDLVNQAVRKKWITRSPIREGVAAVSVGMVQGRLLVDLNYAEDVAADVDMNVVMTTSGKFVEVQGTGEKSTFARAELDRLVTLAARAIRELHGHQAQALRRRISR